MKHHTLEGLVLAPKEMVWPKGTKLEVINGRMIDGVPVRVGKPLKDGWRLFGAEYYK